MEKRSSSPITVQGGSTANKTGNALEQFVQNSLKALGYQYIGKKQFLDFSRQATYPIYTQQILIGETIYGTKRYCDFILFHPEKYPANLIIECKWQQSTGSVDEKFPFLVHNIRKTGIDTIVLLDGRGYKDGAKAWLEGQSGGCLLGVYDMMNFQIQINKGFL